MSPSHFNNLSGGSFGASSVHNKPSGGQSLFSSSLASNTKVWSPPAMGLENVTKQLEGERCGGFERNRGIRHLSYRELME